MRLILISWPTVLEEEFFLLDQLFGIGLEVFHLRKPDYSRDELAACIQQIDKKYRSRVVLHSHHDLADQYDLKGVHFTGRYSFEDEKGTLYPGSRSRSFHCFDEVKNFGANYDYLFLSPVFPSISKPGYSRSFDLGQVERYLRRERAGCVIALGGVELRNIDRIKAYGFDGAALLGTVWQPMIERGGWQESMEVFKLLMKQAEI